jgi:predicted ATPase
MDGQHGEGCRVIEQGMQTGWGGRQGVAKTLSLALQAEVQGQRSLVDEALAHIHEALAIVERTGERYGEPKLHRLKGAFLHKRNGIDAAQEVQACYLLSLACAHRQGAKSWELRTAMSLARLWRDQGDVETARKLLAPVYEWFTEGFAPPISRTPRPCLLNWGERGAERPIGAQGIGTLG